jgi:hypothetical protein
MTAVRFIVLSSRALDMGETVGVRGGGVVRTADGPYVTVVTR